MIISNPIYDLLIKIKNGQIAKKNYICLPKNKLFLKILKIIYNEGYIKHYSISNDTNKVKVWLKYYNNIPTIKNLSFFPVKKNSIFLSLIKIWKIDSDLQLLILSTNKGFLSGKESKKYKVGGKLICIIE